MYSVVGGLGVVNFIFRTLEADSKTFSCFRFRRRSYEKRAVCTWVSAEQRHDDLPDNQV